MQLKNHWSDSAIARVHAGCKNACVTTAMCLDALFVQHTNHFIQVDGRRRSREAIPTFRSPLRLHQPCLIEYPHQLAGVGDRDSLKSGNLRKRQRLLLSFRTCQLQKSAQSKFFLGRYLHFVKSPITRECNESLLLSQHCTAVELHNDKAL